MLDEYYAHWERSAQARFDRGGPAAVRLEAAQVGFAAISLRGGLLSPSARTHCEDLAVRGMLFCMESEIAARFGGNR